MKQREGFSSGLTVFLVTLSSAVGLGNIWLFPYLTGSNGGAAFILIYLSCIAIVGLPVMLCEFFMGRRTKKNIIGAVTTLSNKKAFKSIGYLGMASTAMIAFFYAVVAGWVYSYVLKSITGTFKGVNNTEVKEIFTSHTTSIFPPVIWILIVLTVVAIILISGVKKGIEKVAKVLMPILLILLVICAVKSLTLSGAKEGINFLIKPDFSKVNMAVVVSALGLSFFKLSLGMGTMTTYASYYTKDSNLYGNAAKVIISDTLVSLLAGLAIFPAVFSFGLDPSSGPSLLFETIPLIFSKIPGGSILIVAFFLTAAFASTMALISMIEVLVAYFTEEKKMDRTKAVIAIVSVVFIVSAITSMTVSGGVLSKYPLFDTFDKLTSSILLPLGGLIIAIFIGWFVNKKDFLDELSNEGALKQNVTAAKVSHIIIKFVTPILLIIVFLSSIGVI